MADKLEGYIDEDAVLQAAVAADEDNISPPADVMGDDDIAILGCMSKRLFVSNNCSYENEEWGAE
jgi:hypothetical protein